MNSLREQVEAHLHKIYAAEIVTSDLIDQVISAIGIVAQQEPALRRFDADEVVLITYGDTIRDGVRAPLAVLDEFLHTYLGDVISSVHVLPFFVSSSDGGFSVVDYRQVAPALGDWSDIERLATGRNVMVDLIVNHASAQSDWFGQFLAGEAPGRDFFVTATPDDDLSAVVRPRTHPLLKSVEVCGEERWVWATFSHDQIDLNFVNPEVLVEFCRIIDFYIDHGATRLRLDAIAYLWKQIGTSSIHLPQTHEVVKLFNTLLAARAPEVLLVTETNVPHAENVSYFGESDEAHVVYNFTLVPLVLHTLLAESSTAITAWLSGLDATPAGTTYLNFLASHDGMGLRPAEGLLSDEQIDALVEAAEATGGSWSAYATPAGDRPYELNASLADVLAGRDLTHVERFLCAHAIMLGLPGIPAIYVHSLLASPGDHLAARESGVKRDVNRSWVTLVDAAARAASSGPAGQAFQGLCELVRVRRAQPAFSPGAAFRALDLGEHLVAFERTGSGQTIVALSNVSSAEVRVELGRVAAGAANDLLTGESFSSTITLAPWQTMWLEVGQL